MLEDSIREKTLRQWVKLQNLGLARISNPKMAKVFFLVDWRTRQVVVGGPQEALDEVEEFLRADMPAPPKPRKRGA